MCGADLYSLHDSHRTDQFTGNPQSMISYYKTLLNWMQNSSHEASSVIGNMLTVMLSSYVRFHYAETKL